MNKANTIGSLALFAASCAVAPAVLAAPCGGTNINHTLTWSPTEIVKGSQVSIWKGTSVIVSNDPSAPFHLAAGECVGSFIIGADGKPISAHGHCARKDKDGDVIYEEWFRTGDRVGNSKVVGGTGKFTNASWTFTWQDRPLRGPSNAVPWTGECQ